MKTFEEYGNPVRNNNPNLQAMINMLNDHAKQIEELENANDDLTQICFLQGEKLKNLEKKLKFIMENTKEPCRNQDSLHKTLKELYKHNN